jgi:hypothetical protein
MTIANSIWKYSYPGAEPIYRAIEKKGFHAAACGTSAQACRTRPPLFGLMKDNGWADEKVIEERYGRQISAVRKH